jgi:hypothetical protein
MSITRTHVAPMRGSSDSGAISRHLSKLSASFNGRKMQIYSGSGEETHRVLIMMATYMDRRAGGRWEIIHGQLFNQLNTGVRVIIYSGIQGMISWTQKNISGKGPFRYDVITLEVRGYKPTDDKDEKSASFKG